MTINKEGNQIINLIFYSRGPWGSHFSPEINSEARKDAKALCTIRKVITAISQFPRKIDHAFMSIEYRRKWDFPRNCWQERCRRLVWHVRGGSTLQRRGLPQHDQDFLFAGG